MDVYWSVDRCGWVPCDGPAGPLATPWSGAEGCDPSPPPVPDVPQQRSVAEVPAER